MIVANQTRPLRVVVIEDSWLMRQSLVTRLEELGRVEIVGDAVDECSAIALLQHQQTDLAIVDLQLREGSGLGVLQALSSNPERFGSPRAIVFSHHSHTVVRERCFALGIERFFDKATQFEDLLTYVRQAIGS